jgi:hypothetical protein
MHIGLVLVGMILIIALIVVMPSILVTTGIVPAGSLKIIKFSDPNAQIKYNTFKKALDATIATMKADPSTCAQAKKSLNTLKENIAAVTVENPAPDCIDLDTALVKVDAMLNKGGSVFRQVKPAVLSYVELMYHIASPCGANGKIKKEAMLKYAGKAVELLCVDTSLIAYAATDIAFYSTIMLV